MIDIRTTIRALKTPIAGFLFGSVWIWLGTIGMSLPLFAAFLLITAWLQYRYLAESARARRRLFFDSYLAPESPIQRHREIGPATKLFWSVSAFILCLVTAITVFSYGSAHTIAVVFGIATGFILAGLARKLWLQHTHPTFRSYLDSKAVTGAAVLAGAIALFSWEMLSNRADHANLTSTHAADTVIRETHHSVKWVQHMARTNQYASLTMLRMRDNLGNAAGNLIYAYLIIPNFFPIYGMVAILKSFIFLLSPKPRDL
jgi:uncharacterized membrane protein YbaN (DUF454 family)